MGFFSNFGKTNDKQSQQPVGDFNVQNNQQNLNPQAEYNYNQPIPQFYNQAQQMMPQQNFVVDQTRAHQKEILREKNEFYQPQNFNNLNNTNYGDRINQDNNFKNQNQLPQMQQNKNFHQSQIYFNEPHNRTFQSQYAIQNVPTGQQQQHNLNQWQGFYPQIDDGYNISQGQMNYKQPKINYNHPQMQQQIINQNQQFWDSNNFYNPNPYNENNYYDVNTHQKISFPYQAPPMFNNNAPYAYQENYNYQPTPINNYEEFQYESYGKKFKHAKLIEKPMAKEIRSEKVRNILLMFVGLFGIVITAIMLAVYYNAGDIDRFMGLKKENVMYPLPSIFFLIVSVACFGWATTDLALLHNGVSKFLNQIKSGNETIPYFITRNYKNMIAREVYVNWIAFSTYIIGAISLGILYFLQGQYQSMIDRGETPNVTFLFWRIATLKSYRTDITINIIVLFAMFGFHIFNIVSTRSRKNNIAGYYNYEPIPTSEIREIKKRANRLCLIILLVVIAIILFAIIIPWLIIRKKQGKSLNPWRSN